MIEKRTAWYISAKSGTKNTTTSRHRSNISSLQLGPVTDWVVGGDMRDDSAESPFLPFLHEAIVNSSGMDRDAHSLTSSNQHYFPLPTTASPTFQDAPEDVFGETGVARDTPEPREVPSLDSCQKRVLWAKINTPLFQLSMPGRNLMITNRCTVPRNCWFSFISIPCRDDTNIARSALWMLPLTIHTSTKRETVNL